MRVSITPFFALLGVAQGHYNFNRIYGSGIQATTWQYMREVALNTSNPYAHQVDPMYLALGDMDSDRLRCNRGGATPKPGIQTLPIKAGAKIGFNTTGQIVHQGPLLGYMAKVPVGTTAASWDASGKVWFKIFQDKIKSFENTPEPGEGGVTSWNVRWENTGKSDVEFTLPKSLPNGEYLFRVEHIGLHGIIYEESVGGGPQFFVSCAHLLITDGGTGTPGPLVEFPGAYKRGEPGFSLYPYNKSLTWDDAMKYQPPGPPVWVG